MRTTRELIPNPLRTYEEWERSIHADIPRLSDKELLVELWRVQNGLADPATDDPDGWLWERWEVLSRELRYGDVAVELDALPVDALQARVRHEVKARMDMEALRDVARLETEERARLTLRLGG